MKRGQQIDKGVYQYSTGQVGTDDLPAFIADVCARKHNINKRKAYFLNRLGTTPSSRQRKGWRSQLAATYAQFKTNNKRHTH